MLRPFHQRQKENMQIYTYCAMSPVKDRYLPLQCSNSESFFKKTVLGFAPEEAQVSSQTPEEFLEYCVY